MKVILEDSRRHEKEAINRALSESFHHHLVDFFISTSSAPMHMGWHTFEEGLSLVSFAWRDLALFLGFGF